MQPIAYRGLETGERDVVTHVVRKNKIVFTFSSALNPDEMQMGQHLVKHGDGVKDVAFRVKDARGIFARAVERGAKPVREPYELTDANGTVVLATVQTYGDTVHTFVDRTNYHGSDDDFLPGFSKPLFVDPLLEHLYVARVVLALFSLSLSYAPSLLL